MKKIKTFALLFLLSATFCLFADPDSKSQKCYQQYKNGFAISINSVSSGGAGLGFAYYFLKNNSAALTLIVSPYQRIKNYNYQKGLNYNKTSLGGSLEFFIPLWRNQLNNTVFLDLGVGSVERIGKAPVVSRKNKLKYRFTIDSYFGLQYRFNDHLYFTMVSRVRYKDSQLEEATYPIGRHQTSVIVFADSLIKLTTKF